MKREIKIALTMDGEPRSYDEKRFEQIFSIRYFSHLRFADWQGEKWIRKKCAKAKIEDKIGDLAIWLGKLHGKALEEAAVPDVSIRWIGEAIGYGLFSNKGFKKWDFIGEYTGLLRQRKILFPDINDYCFMYPTEWRALKAFTIDSVNCGNFTRFINHSDTPNLESVAVFHDGIFHILFRTIQEIPPNTQLTYDYGDIYWRKRKKISP